MVLDMLEYSSMMKNLNVNIIYSGPLWDDGIRGIAEMVRTHLTHEQITGAAAKSVFSVFIEQITNMLMYSSSKELYTPPDKDPVEVSTGTLVLGETDRMFFIQTGNAIKKDSVELIKRRIDYLNTLDKAELRKFHKEQLNAKDDNPDSKGAGLGLIEIARRATAPIRYSFEPLRDDSSVYFTMYVEIEQARKEGGLNNGL